MNKKEKKKHIILRKDDGMKEAPAMISTKDLAYLTDIFGWNFIAAKKAYHFKNEVQDEEIKDLMNRLFELHKEQCDEVLSILE